MCLNTLLQRLWNDFVATMIGRCMIIIIIILEITISGIFGIRWMFMWRDMWCCPFHWVSKCRATENTLNIISIANISLFCHWRQRESIFKLNSQVSIALDMERSRRMSMNNVWVRHGNCIELVFVSFFHSKWIKVMHNLCILENEYWQGIKMLKSIKWAEACNVHVSI